MQIGVAGGDAAAGGAHHETLLDQKGFDHVFDRAALLAQRSGEAFDTNRAAVELFDDRQQELAIHHIETLWIHIEHVQCGLCDLVGDSSACADLRVIAHTP